MEQLIQECKQNNLQAQSQIYQIFAAKLFALSLKYCRNYQDAEDVLQDSFLKAFDKIHQYKNKGSFEGWLRRVVITTALQKYKDKTQLYIVKEEIDVKEEEVSLDESNIDIDVLLSLIQELPDRYRLVFNLYVLDNFSHKEIADLLSISEGTSKSNLSRAKKILKSKLEAYQLKLEKA
ncbi:RNA polymerase sigma factor [uncultured Tenacibaculum sp.]|uniref:RNA polymerase sigma factor n=1 Tax=uncultured Tenacibaculum sp. TaxID=174713 RepID=UPI002795885E|nr:RNA polymerase sigma factor [uncultured Tenacibaculum sp.]